MKETQEVKIRPAEKGEAEWLQTSFASIGWTKPDGYFQECTDKQHNNNLVLLLAEQDLAYIGHCKISETFLWLAASQ